MLEELNFQNFGITGRKEHKLDVFVKIKIAEKIFHRKDSEKPVTGILLGNVEGEELVIKKIFFYQIYEIEDNQILFNREDTTSLIEHFKKLYDMSVVGWFINREL